MIHYLRNSVVLSMLILSIGTVAACDETDGGVALKDQYDLEDEKALVADSAEAAGSNTEIFAAPVDDEVFSGLQDGQQKVYNLCESLSLYQFNPANHGTDGNPKVEVGMWKKLIWQTLSGTPNGWATVLSAGQEEWGWRYARVECLGGAW